jgi:hypothetical protein
MYGKFYETALKAGIANLSAEGTAVKVMLCTSTYTPNQNTHSVKADVTNEVVGAGYTAGGAELTAASKTVSYSTLVTTFDAPDVVWSDSTITARYAIVYDATTAGNPLILWVDFGEDKISSAGTFTITWHADGIFTVTVA